VIQKTYAYLWDIIRASRKRNRLSNSSFGKNWAGKVKDLIILANWRRVLFVIFFIFLIPVYWIAYRAPAVGIFHDDGIYLVTAKALAEGEGYRIVSLPSEMPQTKYPVLFPAILAIAWKIFPQFPDNVYLLKTVPLVSAFLWFWMAFRLLKKELDNSNIIIWIILFTAASPHVVFYSSTVSSETLFSCLCTGTLLWLHHLEVNPGVREGRAILISSTLAAAAILTRTVGIPLLFAGTLALLMKRRYKVGLKYFSLCVIFIAPWFWWQLVHSVPGELANGYYSLSNYKNWNTLMNFTSREKTLILLKNFLFLFFYPNAFLGIKWSVYGLAFSLAFTSFAILGFLGDIRLGFNSIHLFLLFYIGIILAWAWPPSRFLVPILPFMLLYAYKGLILLCTYISKFGRVQMIISQTVVLVLSLCLSYALYWSTAETLRKHQVSYAYSSRDDWREMSSLFSWIRKNAPKDAVALGLLDPTIYLYTGRKAVHGIVVDPLLLWYSDKPRAPRGEVSDFVNTVVEQRVSYIIRTPAEPFKEGPSYNRLLDTAMQTYPEVFRIVKEGSESTYKIYKVDTERLQRALTIKKNNS